jgi:hypothetical protein
MKKLTIKDFKEWGSVGGKKNSKAHMKRIAKLPRKLKVKSETPGDYKVEVTTQKKAMNVPSLTQALSVYGVQRKDSES